MSDELAATPAEKLDACIEWVTDGIRESLGNDPPGFMLGIEAVTVEGALREVAAALSEAETRAKQARNGLVSAIIGLELASKAHASIVMDTAEDERLKDEVVASTQLALDLARAALAVVGEQPQPISVGGEQT